MIAINLDIRFTGMRLAVHAYAAFRIKLHERPLPFKSFGFTAKNNHEHAVRGDIFLSLDGGMVCLSGCMNNTSLGTLDLLHVYVELMAEICGYERFKTTKVNSDADREIAEAFRWR